VRYGIHLVKGFLIGIANIIPGVSGGTFALILGIFDRLVDAIKSFDLALIRTYAGALARPFDKRSRQRIAAEWKRTDATFLTFIGIGALVALVSCAWIFDYLLREHPAMTLAFFIGLIIPSIAVPYKMMEHRDPAHLFWIVPGAVLTVWISMLDIAGGTGEPGFIIVFLGGMLAISAMILPGVSGSFCLLILGLYQPTLSHIKAMTHSPTAASVIFLGTLGLGVVIGLVLFSRIMSFLLKRYRSATLAFLIGLIIGSFWILWPIKDFGAGTVVTDSRGEEKKEIAIATAPNRLPGGEKGDLWLVGKCGVALLIGLGGASGVSRLGKVKEKH
jgi:putative membrane protein